MIPVFFNRRSLAGALALAVSLASFASAQAATSFPDSAAALFKALAGHWSCEGGFARGGALSADLAFAPALGDYAITLQHADRAPGSYWQTSTWAFDGKAKRIVSAGMAGSQKDRTGAPTLFSSSAWSATSVTLEADTIKAPPFTPNRFTYSVTDGATLKMRWEVGRNGAWALGDSLVCSRAP
jgi:hypothetical protein